MGKERNKVNPERVSSDIAAQTQPKLPILETGATLKTAAIGSKNPFSGGITHEKTHYCFMFSYSI